MWMVNLRMVTHIQTKCYGNCDNDSTTNTILTRVEIQYQ